MSTSTKQQELHAMNVEGSTSKTDSLSEQQVDYSPEQVKRLTSQYPSSIVRSADTLTQSSSLRNLSHWARYCYSGIQGQIYGDSSDEEYDGETS
jgi:hypothetical protein